MKKIILAIVLQLIGVAGFSQSLPLQRLGEPIHGTNFELRWRAPANGLPSSVWVYRLLPRKTSPETISNLLAMGGFTEKDKRKVTADGTIYKDADRNPKKQFGVSTSLGTLYYEISVHQSPTNLISEVPDEKQVQELAKKLLSGLGVNIGDLEKRDDGIAPKFSIVASEISYFVNSNFISCTTSRGVLFKRSVDNGVVLGGGAGGDGEIEFGDHSKVIKIDISWPNLKRFKSYSIASPEKIMQRIQKGKAVLEPNGDPHGINWGTVKSVTINKAQIAFYAGDRFGRSEWLMPFMALSATVDTGDRNIEAGIDCAIIDETKP